MNGDTENFSWVTIRDAHPNAGSEPRLRAPNPKWPRPHKEQEAKKKRKDSHRKRKPHLSCITKTKKIENSELDRLYLILYNVCLVNTPNPRVISHSAARWKMSSASDMRRYLAAWLTSFMLIISFQGTAEFPYGVLNLRSRALGFSPQPNFNLQALFWMLQIGESHWHDPIDPDG